MTTDKLDKTHKELHKELHKEIYDCSCIPLPMGTPYCENCEKAVIEFMRKNGAGVLTRDIEIEEFEKEVCKSKKLISELTIRLNLKSTKYEALKKTNKLSPKDKQLYDISKESETDLIVELEKGIIPEDFQDTLKLIRRAEYKRGKGDWITMKEKFVEKLENLIDTLSPKKDCVVIHQIKEGVDKLALEVFR